MYQPPNPALACAHCLYQLAFGYDRIARTLFGSTKRRHKVYDWKKYHGWSRPVADAFTIAIKARLVHNAAQPGYRPPQRKLTDEELAGKREARFAGKTHKYLRSYLQTMIWHFLKRNKHARHTPRLIGCTRDELRAHLQARFKPGMTFENYGEVWEIDHIIPVSKFNIFNLEERLKCYHFSNLQPLTGHENAVKATKC